MTLDAAGLQVLMSRLGGIADEMGAVLRRSASSPNIKERADCSAAVFDATGELLAQAEHIPVHLGSMPASVRAAIEAYGGWLEPGDHVVVNDPFAGGTHLNDITVVTPVFDDERGLIGWVANRAHHADVGGAAPGSIPADATEIQQEGLRIPAHPLHRGAPQPAPGRVANADERAGDLDAQIGANVVGYERLVALGEAPFDEVIAYGERRMRAVLAALPDGRWRCEDVLDSTGAARDLQRAARIVVTVTVAGDEITFDFTGTDPQSRGNVNAVTAVTVSAGRVRAAHRDRPDHPGERRVAAPGARRRPGGDAGERSVAGRGGRRQRRGEPADR
jgi:N-methylhydantoinase B/oxoprolinase/acetone carboxylase alpha subunit